jgi:hypothetical protein
MYKGSDVRLATGILTRPGLWPRRTIAAARWKWKISFSYEASEPHINIGELKAVLASLRWRTRSSACIGTRCLHITDSQVALGILVKGRSSSIILRNVVHRLNALVLASSLNVAYAYVRTDLNPADKPSRWRKRKRD